jgi:transcription antitermination factor NusG
MQIAQSLSIDEIKIYNLVESTLEKLGISNRFDPLVNLSSQVFRYFPGCILVYVHLDKKVWKTLRNTPGITGFLGNGNQPIPLSAKDVFKVLKRISGIEWICPVGQPVRVLDEAFKEFQCVLVSDPLPNLKVRVEINFFGRPRTVEFYPWEMEKSETRSSGNEPAIHVNVEDLPDVSSLVSRVANKLKNRQINDLIFTTFEQNVNEVLEEQKIVLSRAERMRLIKKIMKNVLEEILDRLR